MSQEISQELATRLADAARAVVANWSVHIGLNRECAELQAIVAELPAPVDHDLPTARQIVSDWMDTQGGYSESYKLEIRSGRLDDDKGVQCALAAIRHARTPKASS